MEQLFYLTPTLALHRRLRAHQARWDCRANTSATPISNIV
jgi:hypothetical protein